MKGAEYARKGLALFLCYLAGIAVDVPDGRILSDTGPLTEGLSFLLVLSLVVLALGLFLWDEGRSPKD